LLFIRASLTSNIGNVMNVILYAGQNSKNRERLTHAIHTLFPNKKTESHSTIESLEGRLRQFIREPVVFVVQISTDDEWMQLLAFRDWLIGKKLILVLPDDNRETIAKGHVLHPRFVTYSSSDFKDVASVLEKMLAYAADRRNADYFSDWPEESC
jgi:hypothetical protein